MYSFLLFLCKCLAVIEPPSPTPSPAPSRFSINLANISLPISKQRRHSKSNNKSQQPEVSLEIWTQDKNSLPIDLEMFYGFLLHTRKKRLSTSHFPYK